MRILNIFKLLIITALVMMLLVAAVVAGGYFYLNPKLPSIEGLSDVQLQVPLRIYSSDGALMGEFGEKRRTPKKLEEIPELMQQAFLSAEDDRFFEHPGVDYQGILRAVINLVMLGLLGVYLIYEAIWRFFEPQEITGWTVIVVASIALIVDAVTAAIMSRAVSLACR